QQFKCISGQINPDSVTWATMQRLTGNANGGPQSFSADWLNAVTTKGRADIEAKGIAEARCGPGSDVGRPARSPRQGGDILKNYFDKATKGAINWTGRGKIKPDGTTEWIEISNLDGVMKSNYRIPQESKDTGASWCCIFATYILQQANLPVYWKMGKGL